MLPNIVHITDQRENAANVFITSDINVLSDFGFSTEELKFIEEKSNDKQALVTLPGLAHNKFVKIIKDTDPENEEKEELRIDGYNVCQALAKEKQSRVTIYDVAGSKASSLAIAEGLALASYSFNKYKTEDKDQEKKLTDIFIASAEVNAGECTELQKLCEAVFITRDLVNEPVNKLDVEQLSKTVRELSEQFGFSAEIYNKIKIESLKMGGLLAVNRGSQDPPAFMVLEWKPEDAKNEKPLVLVGKGVVFDTGGINLKTPPGSLDDMKADMGGAASVIGTMIALSSNNVPYHVIGLIPATDNRPGFNAYVPGDIITMFNGKTVEVINTDAEGRMILADALSYADKYDPELIIDLATLTGSAMVAIGHYGTVAMGTADNKVFNKLEEASYSVHERVVKFPFWKDYDELIKSEIADMKNLGGRDAGAITAGKFLSNFTSHPWIHLDIAGPAFVHKEDKYRGNGGTGVGVRLLYKFISGKINK
jgi:leucyl aminopeptidase